MKRIKYLLFTLIIMMFVSLVNVDAASISVKSVKMVDHSGNVTEVNEPKPNGLNIKFDLSFAKLGDTVKYEVVLDNPTNKEYEINTDKQFSGSNYISYSYELKDKTNRIKANSEVILYITVKYENQVPADKLIDGKYIENNDMGINILNEDNPNTFNNILWIVFVLFLLVILTLVIKYTKKKELFVIIFALLLVPATVFALEKLKLTVSTKITIEEKYNVYYLYEDIIETSKVTSNKNVINCYNEKLKIENNDSFTEYSYCTLLEKDNNTYRPGDNVNIETSVLHDFNDIECTYDSQNNSYSCPTSEIPTTSTLYYDYMCGSKTNLVSVDDYISFYQGKIKSFSKADVIGPKLTPKYLNLCTQEEFNNMNFISQVHKEWYEDFGDYTFNAPNRFTMPHHDVYILKRIPHYVSIASGN